MTRKVLVAITLCALCASLWAGKVQDELNRRLQGAWVILDAPVSSTCDGGYTNNKVNGDRILSGDGFLFREGELAQITKVDLKRSRVDVLLQIITPYRISWQDGPFQLYDHRTCQVELLVDLPRDMVRQKQTGSIEAAILQVMKAFSSREDALSSDDYNGRETEPLPANYQQTLADYEEWKREEFNRLLAEEIHKCREQYTMILKDVRESPEYGAGFTRGIREMLRALPFDCDQLARATEFSYKKTISSSENATRDYREGYEDGQLLAFYMTRADRLDGCFQ